MTPSTGARCEIVILVCAMARSPATSIEEPPRKCRMRTPRFQPSSLPLMNSSNVPWNQVAIMRPSACQTVRKRSHSRASRHTAQFSTSWRMVTLSAAAAVILRQSVLMKRHCEPTGPARSGRPDDKLREAIERRAPLDCFVAYAPRNDETSPRGPGSDVAAFDLLAQRLDDFVDVLEVGIDRQRPAIGFERVLVVTEFLHDETEPGPRAEMARLPRQHLADVAERAAVIFLQEMQRGAPVPG